MTSLYDYWKSKSVEERDKFCQKAGVTYGYMESHLIHGRKKPRMETLQAIVNASEGELNHEGLFDFFLSNPATA